MNTDPLLIKSSSIENEHLSSGRGVEEMSNQIKAVNGINLSEFLTEPGNREKFKYKKIVVAGPPRSGKSCFNKGIKSVIKAIPGAPYPLVLTACPDGEGAWFQETMNSNPELAAKIKAEYKSKFTPEFVKRVAGDVKTLGNESCPLNFIDIGGIITPENAQICEGANAAIILVGETAIKEGLAAEWKNFFDELGIPVIAEIYSDYNGKEDFSLGVADDGVFRGSLHRLERGEDLNSRQTLKELASHILTFEKRDYKLEEITNKVTTLVRQWQTALPGVEIVLGGSLVSGLFILDDKTEAVDVDLRFLVKDSPIPDTEAIKELIRKIEEITGLKYRKSITVSDWPSGSSEGIQIEGELRIEGVDLPLDVGGCLRNSNYVGWAKFYKQVLTQEELDFFKSEKIRLRDNKIEYKALKQKMIEEVQKRCLEKGLVTK